MRRTTTSCEVKDRYNRKNYDQILIRTGKGGREAIQTMAAARGKSVAEYIRGLVIADAAKDGANGEISALLGGGGNIKELRGTLALSRLPL